ncbi:MAG: glycosyltransferase family 2 protein [Ignavibacteriaceae bacterium]
MNSSKNRSRVCAVIPFYNEEPFIRDVVQNTLKFVDLVFAVNDGSTDNSEKLINDFNNVIILSSDQNRGKGYALKLGFYESLKRGFDIIVTLDADNQHNPDFIPVLINELNGNDIIIGNRLNNMKDMPFIRIFSNKITSTLLSIKTKQKIIDSQCGFRAYKRNVLEKVKTTSEGFEAESEILILSARAGFRIGFVNIPTVYANERSKMNPVEAIIGFINILFR